MRRFRTLLGFLCVTALLQVGLLWVQGAQLHRQNRILVALRGDIQELADIVDQMQNGQGQESEGWSPTRFRARGRFLRVRQEPQPAQEPPSGQEEDAGVKEMRQSRESAEKAVRQARQAQEKLSISEAAKRAEEKRKLEAAENVWMKWVWGALGLVVLALLLRGWWRSRR